MSERRVPYENAYMADYGFERDMVFARQRTIVELIDSLKPRSVVELGCGDDLLVSKSHAGSIKQWIIIEPAEGFAARARERVASDPRCSVIESIAEDATAAVRAHLPGGADLVVCSSLLHEVDAPARLLGACRAMLAPSGTCHINVPNALSFHRRLARTMGLVRSEYEPSARNLALAQPSLFDRQSLRALVEANELEVANDGGYFVKPFTHVQMELARSILTDKVLEGLWSLGRELPDLASEIFVNVKLQ